MSDRREFLPIPPEVPLHAIRLCPGCGRDPEPKLDTPWACTHCRYEASGFEEFPTIAQILQRTRSDWSDVALGPFLRKLLEPILEAYEQSRRVAATVSNVLEDALGALRWLVTELPTRTGVFVLSPEARRSITLPNRFRPVVIVAIRNSELRNPGPSELLENAREAIRAIYERLDEIPVPIEEDQFVGYVSREMALDAGEPGMEGEPIGAKVRYEVPLSEYDEKIRLLRDSPAVNAAFGGVDKGKGSE